MVGFILATDMAKHMEDLTSFKNKLENKGISKLENNGPLFIDHSEDTKRFASQQQMLELLAHASDVSQSTRNFDTVRKWTYLLFEEFFDQGDIEREEGLPVSFLCDRTTTNVPSNQPGFINFIVTPLYTAITECLPPFQQALDSAKANVVKWQNYEETKQDEESYKSKRKLVKVSVPDLQTVGDKTSLKSGLISKIDESESEDSQSSSSDPSNHPPEGRPSLGNPTSSDKYLHKRNKNKKKK